MLSPEARTVFLDDLRPPAGYQLDAAVATTYTLSLEAALLPALAFVAATVGEADSAEDVERGDPVLLLEAIRATTEKLDIFCQAGLISVPSQAPDLAAFMEPMLHQMPRTRRGGLFHPKLWLLRFRETDGDAMSLRLLIMSRNLTLDDSWDISVRLDSSGFSDEPLPDNEPLASLIRDLPSGAIHPLTAARASRVRSLADDVSRVHWERPAEVESLQFHRGGRGLPETLATYGPILIVSPFVTDDLARTIGPNSNRRLVVSRPDSLDQLSPETLAELDATYILDPTAELLHPSDDDDDEAPARHISPAGRTLHAKAYVVDLTRRYTKSALLLGSANATAPGFALNEELLVEFVGPRKVFGINATLGLDDDGEPSDNHANTLGGFLAEYSTDGGATAPAADREELEFERRLLTIGEIPHTITVIRSDEGIHEVRVASAAAYPLPDGWAAQLRLLTRPAELRNVAMGQPVDICFDAIGTADLSAYLIVSLTAPNGHTRSATLVAHLQGAPRDRLDHVLARQIDTPDKFMRYVLLVLSMDQPHFLSQLALTDTTRDNDATGPAGTFGSAGLLELVLRNLRHRPGTIAQLDRLMRRLRRTEEGRSRIPPEVARLWPQIVKAAREREQSL